MVGSVRGFVLLVEGQKHPLRQDNYFEKPNVARPEAWRLRPICHIEAMNCLIYRRGLALDAQYPSQSGRAIMVGQLTIIDSCIKN
jgi:hypothetical protein